MEFAWNLQKNLMSDIKGLEKEQNREGKISNGDINLSNTHLNYDLIQSNLNLYQRIKQRVEEVKCNSRIQKNSIVDCSNIITVPKEQATIWGKEKTKEYFKAVCEIFKEQFGAENVVSAMVHLDETAPHMHLHFVPISEEGKLQARKVTTREKLKLIHDTAPKQLQELGFEVTRGMGATKRSLEIHKFKALTLKENINALEGKLNALEGDLKALNAIKGDLGRIDNVKAKKSPLSGKISINEDDYKLLLDLSKKSIVLSSNVDTLQLKVNDLETKLNEKTLNIDERLKLAKLQIENKDLKSKIDTVNKTLRIMSPEFQNEFLKVKKDFEKQNLNSSKSKTNSVNLER